MKQYDTIWVPDDDGDYEVCDIEYITPERGRLSPESNVIVLTLEQLREVWDMATKNGQMIEQVKLKRPYTPSPNFEQYLTSKGIQVP